MPKMSDDHMATFEVIALIKQLTESQMTSMAQAIRDAMLDITNAFSLASIGSESRSIVLNNVTMTVTDEYDLDLRGK